MNLTDDKSGAGHILTYMQIVNFTTIMINNYTNISIFSKSRKPKLKFNTKTVISSTGIKLI